MSKLLIAALLAAAFPTVPAAAHAPAEPASELQRQTEAMLAYIGAIAEAMNIHGAAMKKLSDARPLMDSMTNPAAVKANAAQMRAVLGAARAEIARSDAALGRIVPPAGIRLANGVTGTTMLAEARDQNAKALKLLAEFDAFLASTERGDRAEAARAAPRLMEGSLLMLDGNAMTYRNRQAAMAPAHSVHQVLGIGFQLNRAMGVAGRAWIGARFGGKGEAAAAQLKAQLAGVSGTTQSMTRDGRANLARELRELKAKTAGVAFSAKENAMLDRLRRATAARESLFVLGDELARLADSNATLSGAALAAQPTPQLLGELADLEMRFQAAVAEQAATAAGTAQ